MCRPSILLNSFALCIWSVAVYCVQDWEYVLLRVESNTTNADLVKFDLRPMRVSQGVYACNGTILAGKDFDNSYSVDFKLYRSASGNNDFKATPFGLPTTTFYKFMNSIYIKMLQEDLKDCTNVPQYKGEFEGPMLAGLYTYNKCVISTDGMPGHGQPGVYRATGHFFGDDVDVWISVFLEVFTKAVI
ncbi:uncharacterized protein LOC129915822 [Episyrphus balteatus]|uniref:uncharacterized protein LOC129915822 n=1 Tax=Episyrphus balteatus TaxID=286459 RepID=UPI00248592F1|nr:uncharacterized protein LOC129915822 [Episyrphus balteatus]